MPTHSTTTRNAIADAVVNLVDQGTAHTNGRVRIYTAGKISQLAVVELPLPAFGNADVGVAKALGVPISDTLADASGTPAEFDVVDRDDNIIFSGSIGESDADMLTETPEIAANDIVKIIQLHYTAPP